MKKLLSLLLALALCLSLPAALAELPDFGEPTPAGKEVGEKPQLRQDIGDRSGYPDPIDTVVIKDGVFTITNSGATVAFTPPFGWVTLSTDIVQQLNEYSRMEDPMRVLNKLIEYELSLLAVDPETSTNIYTFFVKDRVSDMVLDFTNEGMIAGVAEYYEGAPVTVAGRTYIRVQTSTALVYFTFHNNVRVSFQLTLDGADPTPEEEAFLLEFIEPTQYL